MPRSLALLPLLLVLTVRPARAGEDPLSALLPRLAAAESARAARQEGRTSSSTSVVEELDGEGKVTSRTDIVERRTRKAGQVQLEVVRATRDGKDVTADVRAERQKAEEKRRKEGKGDNASPFTPERQKAYRFTSLGTDPKQPGLVRIRLTPVEKREELLEGEALVDTERALLLRLEGHPSKMPALANRVDMRFEFGTSTPTGNDLSRVFIDAEGGVLFLRKHMRVDTRIRYEGADASRP